MSSERSRYRIEGQLGKGGMGVVYRADDTLLRRPVALKFLSQTALPEREARARLLREARAVAALNHPNICTIYEVGEWDQESPLPEEAGAPQVGPRAPFIAMELVDGEPLSSVLAVKGSLALGPLLDVGVQIAEGLAEAHGRGIVHRDLKPQNVLLGPGGRVKILDFGLAKPLASAPAGENVQTSVETLSAELSRAGTIAGTVPYMSPEQAQGKPIDARSDVFSFGTMLYEMSCGRRPFRGDNLTSVVAKILESEPETLEGVKPVLPEGLLRVIRRCLQKNPDARYNDTRDLVADLKELRTGGSSVSLRAAPRVRPSARTLKAVAAVAAALLALAAIAVFVLPRLRLAPPAPVRHTQVTFVGDVRLPAISPDGSFVAYVSWSPPQKQRVMVRGIEGGQALPIFEGGYYRSLRWSPDGSQLLVNRDFDGAGTFAIPRLGGTPVPFGVKPYAAWSPDGTRFVSYAPGSSGLVITDRRSGEDTKIAADAPYKEEGKAYPFYAIDWSPSGDRVVYQAYGAESTSFLTVATQGGEPQPLVEATDELLSSPRISARGDAVYYLRENREAKELWKVPVSPATGKRAGEPVLLVGGLEAGYDFSLTRDGRRLLYTRQSRHQNLWLVSRQGPGWGPPRRITSGSVTDSQPSVSPDGTRLAFVRQMRDASNVFVVPLEGGEPTQLTFFSSHNDQPVWSPDGKEIAFASEEGGVHRVWRVAADGGTPRAFEKTELDWVSLAWAPSSRILYARPGRRNFHLLDPRTEEETPLLAKEDDRLIGSAFFSPDARRVLIDWSRDPKPGQEAAPGLSIVSVETRAETPVATTGDQPIGWSADGRSLLLLRSGGESEAVLALPTTGGKPRTVAPLPATGGLLGFATLTPDGTALVYEVFSQQSDLWLMESFDPDVR